MKGSKMKKLSLSRLLVIAAMGISLLVVWSAFTPTVADGFQIGGNVVGDGCNCGDNNTIDCANDGEGGNCPSSAQFDVCSAVDPKDGTCSTKNTGHDCKAGSSTIETGCKGDIRDQQNCSTL